MITSIIASHKSHQVFHLEIYCHEVEMGEEMLRSHGSPTGAGSQSCKVWEDGLSGDLRWLENVCFCCCSVLLQRRHISKWLHFPIKMISSQPSSIKLKQNLVFLSGGLADSPALVVMVVDFPPWSPQARLPLTSWKPLRLLDGFWNWKLTWNLNITQLKRNIIFQTSILGFHVDFPGCSFPFWPYFRHLFFREDPDDPETPSSCCIRIMNPLGQRQFADSACLPEINVVPLILFKTWKRCLLIRNDHHGPWWCEKKDVLRFQNWPTSRFHDVCFWER